jgi:hypothetical protein
MNPTRRVFLATGMVGAAALATAAWLRPRGTAVPSGRALDANATSIVGALVPAFLAGALPAEASGRADAIQATVADVDAAIAGLPPSMQAELAQLFSLLGIAPARWLVAGLAQEWSVAAPADVAVALERWRASRVTLLRSAYDALHQLILGAWYGNPRAWDAIGYPGPPPLIP